MSRSRIRLDSAGMAAMLRSPEVTAAVEALGARVAANAFGATADGEEVPVQTRTRTVQGGRISARQGVDVMLAHPAGIRVEAKHGTLFRAASAAGLEPKGRRPTA